MRTVELDFKTRGPVASDHRCDESALLERLKRAEDRGTAHPMCTQGDIDLVLAEVMFGCEELIEDESALPGQAEAVLGEMLGEHANDLLSMFLFVADGVHDELSHHDRVSVCVSRRNILVITPCYNNQMKRLWPLLVLMLLALPLCAQEGDEAAAPPETATEPPPVEEPAAPVEEAPVAAPSASEDQPTTDDAVEAPVKEVPLISVKVVPSSDEEGDEDSVEPAVETKKVGSTVLVPRTTKKSKSIKAAKGKFVSPPLAVKVTAPALPAQPPPPPVPAVPLTPITPRNP